MDVIELVGYPTEYEGLTVVEFDVDWFLSDDLGSNFFEDAE